MKVFYWNEEDLTIHEQEVDIPDGLTPRLTLMTADMMVSEAIGDSVGTYDHRVGTVEQVLGDPPAEGEEDQRPAFIVNALGAKRAKKVTCFYVCRASDEAARKYAETDLEKFKTEPKRYRR